MYMNDNKDFEVLKIDFECPACKKAEQSAKRIPVSRVIEKLDSFFETDNLIGAKNLLDYWQKEAIITGDLSGELTVVNEILGLSRRMSDEKSGLSAIDRAIELIVLTGMENSPSGATIMINAATTSKAFGFPDKAVSLYEKAAEIYKVGLDENDERNAALYNNFATTLADLARFDEAEDLYKKALALTLGKIDTLLDAAVTYVNMAHLYESKDSPESKLIEECLLAAEEILEDTRIERNAYYAFVAEKCAPSFDYFGYFLTAQNLHKKSREIYERS